MDSTQLPSIDIPEPQIMGTSAYTYVPTRKHVKQLNKNIVRINEIANRLIDLPSETEEEKEVLPLLQFNTKSDKIFLTEYYNAKDEVNSNYKYDDDVNDYYNHCKVLQSLIFEQKYLNTTLADLSSLIIDQYNEEGELIFNIKEYYNNIFLMLNKSHIELYDNYLKSLEEIRNKNDKLNELLAREHEVEDRYKIIFENHKIEFEKDFDIKMAKLKQELAESQDRESRSVEALHNLNNLFTDMKADSNAIRTQNLYEAIRSMQKKLEDSASELGLLRLLPHKLKECDEEIESLTKELNKTKEHEEYLENELRNRTELCKSLVLRESGRLSAIESALERYKHGSDLKSTKELEKALKDARLEVEKAGAGYNILAKRPVGNTVFCLRCSQELDESRRTVEEMLQREKEKEYEQINCLAFRLLLPNLEDFSPTRTLKWTVRLIRSILRCKRKDDILHLQHNIPLVKFPEYVYDYFQPSSDYLANSGYDKDTALYEADEQRWTFYNSLNKFRSNYIEVSIFFHLLNEDYKLDDARFILYVYEAIESQYAIDYVSREDFDNYDELHLIISDEDQSLDTPDILFIPLDEANVVINNVMNRASSSAKELPLGKIFKKSVSLNDENIKIDNKYRTKGSKKAVNYADVIDVLIYEYRQEQALRRGTIQSMFDTATTPLPSNSSKISQNDPSARVPITLVQFITIVRNLNNSIELSEILNLYRLSYKLGHTVVNYESFMDACEISQFFVKSLRLPHFINGYILHRMDSDTKRSLAFLIREHYTLYKPTLLRVLTNLHLSKCEIAIINRWILLLEDELQNDGVGWNVDGTKTLSLYRHVLDTMSEITTNKYESIGEENDPYRVTEIENELTHKVRALITRRNAGEEMKYYNIKKNIKSRIIQMAYHKLRSELRSVPIDVRPLMSKEYMLTKRFKEPWGKPLEERFIPTLISQIYNFEIQLICGNPSQILSLKEVTYFYFITLFGIRSIAERYVDEFFRSLKNVCNSNPRVNDISSFSFIYPQSQLLIFGMKHTFNFFLKCLSLIEAFLELSHSKTMQPSTAKEICATICKNWKSSDVISLHKVFDKTFEDNNTIEPDEFLLFICSEYVQEYLRQSGNLKSLFKLEEMTCDKDIMIDNLVHAVKEFHEGYDLTNVYNILRETYTLYDKGKLTINEFIKICERYNVIEISMDHIEYHGLPRHTKSMWNLLISSWNIFKDIVNDAIAKLKSNPHAVVRSNEAVFKAQTALQRLKSNSLKITSSLKQFTENEVDSEFVEQQWFLYRKIIKDTCLTFDLIE